jgi:hypothetical protein
MRRGRPGRGGPVIASVRMVAARRRLASPPRLAAWPRAYRSRWRVAHTSDMSSPAFCARTACP